MLPSLIDRARPRVEPRRVSDGPLTGWVLSLDETRRRSLFRKLVRADVALTRSFPAYAGVRRIERVCFLLLCEAAASRGLHAGELAMLASDPMRDGLGALAILSRVAMRDEKSSDCA